MVENTYKTLEEISQAVIDKLNISDKNPVCITRAYECVFGASIMHSEGEKAPDGKFLIKSS